MPEQIAWKITYWGLTIKLVAMYGLILVMIVFGLLPSMTTGGIVPATLYSLLAVLSVDFVGRLSCMAAPQVPRRWLHLSIVAQGVGLVSLVVAMLAAGAGKIAGWAAGSDVAVLITGLIVAILCQAVAARLFTVFLQELASSLGREDLLPGLQRLRNQVVATGLTANFTVIVVLVAVALLGSLIFFCCGMLAPIAAGPALLVVFVIAFPIAMAGLVLYCAVLFSYHANLWAIRSEIGRRAAFGRPA